ncbi:hypothetical protein [Streptomyces sp. NPDC003877]
MRRLGRVAGLHIGMGWVAGRQRLGTPAELAGLAGLAGLTELSWPGWPS